MPLYFYTALDAKSRKVKGKIRAEGYFELIGLLKSQRLSLTEYYEKAEEVKGKLRLKNSELSDFSQELSSMISAGVPILRAVEIMAARDVKKPIRELYTAVYNELGAGSSFSGTLENQNEAFPPLFINICRSGEESGRLDLSLLKMAEYYRRAHRLDSRIKAATLYPKLLIVLMTVVVLVIFTLILPRFFGLFEGVELPLITRIVIGFSDFIVSRWYIVLSVVAVTFVLIKSALKNKKTQHYIDRMKLRIPVFGRIFKIIYTARFAQTFGSLYSSGLPVTSAMQISCPTVGNSYIEGQFGIAVDKLRGGETISDAIASIDGFDVKLSLSITIGQESGSLDRMLEAVAADFEYEAEKAASWLLTMLEPALIVIMAAVVGVIALAVMLPIITLYQNIG